MTLVTATLDEEKGEARCVEEGHDVERAAVMVKNWERYEIHQRNVRDKMRVGFATRIDIAKCTLSW